MNLPWYMFLALGLFILVAATMVFFGVRMAMYRADMRAAAIPAVATVIDVDSKTSTSRDSDGRTTTSTTYSFLVEITPVDRPLQRQLVAANFDTEDTWFNDDEVDPGLHGEGSEMPVLMRPDLDYAVSPAGFWAAYLIPTILMGFGGFILAFLSLWCWLAFFSFPKRRRQ